MQIVAERSTTRATSRIQEPPSFDVLSMSRQQAVAAGSVQCTLAHAISCVGTGLHSGAQVRMTLRPAPEDTGVVFRRTDLEGAPVIPARYDAVVDTRLSTVIANGEGSPVRVATIEHLMAALHANGIDNVIIDIDGPETPVLDGSAGEFDFLLQCSGRAIQKLPRQRIEVLERVRVEGANGAYAELRPSRRGLALAMTIDFEAPAIGQQHYAMSLTEDRFRHEVADCRTFVERGDIEALQKIGLARGGSLDNAIVVDGTQILNPCGLRRPHEFVRHKLMDAVGDLYLAGHTLQAGFMGHKSGHCLNNKLLRALFANKKNWRFQAGTQTSRIRAQAAA